MAPAALKTRFILNPHSGHVARARTLVEDFARRRGATVVCTERAGHASALADAALADGCELVVAVGGDGTMNEVAGRLVGSAATLGLVPCGSGDGLGRTLGLHGPIPWALQVLETGRPRTIDSGRANEYPFFTIAGLGFEAEVARRFARLRRRGFTGYLAQSVAAFLRWRSPEFVIAHDGQSERLRTFTLAVANASQYGNNALVAPSASLDDGLLDLTAIPPVSPWNAGSLLFRLFRGTLDHARGVTLCRSPRFVVDRPAPGPLHTDGEVHEAGPTVAFEIVPASLRIMTPLPGSRPR